MLDIDTLRMVQISLAAITFALVYFGTYRTSHATYAGWWSAVVLTSSVSSSLYLFAGTPVQWLADPLGHGLAPVAVTFAWAAARSLRSKRTPWWILGLPGAVVFVLALMDNRDDGTLPGTPALLLAMSVLFALTAVEIWRVLRDGHQGHDQQLGSGTRASVLFMAGTSMFAAIFYAFRLVTFISAGPTSEFYLTWAGPNPTTLVVLVLLVVVTYTVGVLSQLEMSVEWRLRAANDDLTGLLGRNAFMERAESLLTRARHSGTRPTVVLADFDHFKSLNDDHGHAAGDRALEAFGQACRQLLTKDDLACRMGGEEFVLLSANDNTDDAEELVAALSILFGQVIGLGAPCPTVSYGIAEVDETWSLDEAIRRADEAMYVAKRSGRNQTAVYGHQRH